MTTLAYLNELRAKQNMKPLKAWKASKAALADAIAKLTPREMAKDADDIIAAPKKPAKRRDADNSSITLVEIAKELGIHPKIARAKMRRNTAFRASKGNGWTYTAAEKADVIRALTSDRRKR